MSPLPPLIRKLVFGDIFNFEYFKYYETKDKINFKKWKMEAEKWSKTENQFTKYLKLMETELNK